MTILRNIRNMDKIKNKMGQLDLDKFHQKDSNTSQLKRLIKMCH
jgi:hypothetical protein